MGNKITVIVLGRFKKKTSEGVGKTAGKILKILKKKNLEVEIYLGDNRIMKRLNKEFRGKDKAADVLSFEEPRGFINPPSRFKKIGEVCLNIAQPTAHGLLLTAKNQQSVSRKLLAVSYLLAHGILHLLGYSHGRKNDRIKMEKAERKALRKL